MHEIITGYNLDLEDMQLIFASDFHFGHDKEFIYKDRGFTNISEHDEWIISTLRLSKNISKSKTALIYLGDLSMKGEIAQKRLSEIKQIFDHIYFINGNHDTYLKGIKDLKSFPYPHDNITYVGPQATFNIKLNGKHLIKFICSHYPILEIPGCLKEKGILPFYNIHGHVHGRQMDYQPKHCIDVGVDNIKVRMKQDRCWLAFVDIWSKIHGEILPSCETCVNYFGDDAVRSCNACGKPFDSYYSMFDHSIRNQEN